jgi:hypothetical protein
MRAPIPSELLERWERAQACAPAERPVALLAADDSDAAWSECGRMPLGRRDAELLALRERTFGPEMVCLADCPLCQAQVEFSVHAKELELAAADDITPLSLTREGMTISFRLPNTADVAAATAERDPAAARRRLFARCLVSATRADGTEAAADDVPDELVRTAGERMTEADPQADLMFALRCPQCDGAWEAAFDVAAFFWQELHVWARRLLREVHELASAYGWSQGEILALSPARRHAYLELIRT